MRIAGCAAAALFSGVMWAAPAIDRIGPVAQSGLHGAIAPESLAAVVGRDLPGGLPVRVMGVDATVVSSDPSRILFLVPPGTPEGPVEVISVGDLGTLVANVRNVSPALFTLQGTGSGIALGDARGRGGSAQPVGRTQTGGGIRASVLDPVGTELILTLEGTGFRHARQLTASIDGVPVPVRRFGPSPVDPGRDQVELGPVPAELGGRGLVEVQVDADGYRANAVRVAFAEADAEPPTFSKEIVRLFQDQYQGCHRPGGSGPFSLVDYASARPWARSIKSAVARRHMPPFKPVAGHGSFHNERRLTPEQIDLIGRWVDAGAPEGNPANLPEIKKFSSDWTNGPPDVVAKMPSPYTPKIGVDDYRCFSIPLELGAERFVNSVEVRPGNNKIVHHVFVYADPYHLSTWMPERPLGQPDYECFGGPRFFLVDIDNFPWMLGAWVPGNGPIRFPDEMGIRFRARSRLVIQVHYSGGDGKESDQTEVGLYFSKHPSPRPVFISGLEEKSFVIPAGESKHKIVTQMTLDVPVGIRILGYPPHMHLIGREIRADKIAPDGTRTPLIYIDDWDFNWQDSYMVRDKVVWRQGETVRMEALYDNSSANRFNPNRDSPKEVRNGEKTTDEMCVIVFFVTLDLP